MKLLDCIKRYKWILVGILLCIFIGISVVFGVHYYQYRSSVEYAFGKVQSALQTANIPQLAHLIDFRKIGSSLAKETAATFPFFAAGPHQVDRISNEFQGNLLKLLKNRLENEDAKITDKDELLKKTFYVLPNDVVAQLAANCTLQRADKQSAIITSSFEHPLLGRKIPLVFRIQKTESGWLVTDLINARDVVKGYRTLIEERLRAQHDVQVKKAEAAIKEMHSVMDIQSCTANAGVISDNKTLMVVVHLVARNKTGFTVKNVNAATSILNAQHDVVLFRNLNTAEQTPPAADFSHRWTIELDATSPEGRRVLAAGPLSCQAVWRTITMSNARVYHAQTPGELENCRVHADPHVSTLCTMEIFRPKEQHN